jgi:hypothetical protein
MSCPKIDLDLNTDCFAIAPGFRLRSGWVGAGDRLEEMHQEMPRECKFGTISLGKESLKLLSCGERRILARYPQEMKLVITPARQRHWRERRTEII